METSNGAGKYDPKKIEEKWQKYWEKHPELVLAEDKSTKEKKYILDMFPYPSGEGLHVGHVESFTATDIISRYLRMNGKNVLHPTGWDAFGLPAENYAIKVKTHPSVTTQRAINNFRRQMKMMGFSYDFSREVDSTNPNYYKWTQWFFLFLYKNGLAYKKKAKANWCDFCKTVLANEQVVAGKCERCGNIVVQKDLEQWFFKITDFIEDKPHSSPLLRKERRITSGLISGLEKVDWPESTKAAQKNWIGRSEGAIIKFQITNDKFKNKNSKLFLEVFTTRLDTIYGCTYMVIAPEHPFIEECKLKIENYKEIRKYQEETRKKTDLARMESKEKTGVKIKGIKAINPFTKKEIPVYVADYVLAQYGTGAVMAVPAHDGRDFEFAKKYGLPVVQSITPNYEDYKENQKVFETLKKVCDASKKKNIDFWVSSGLACMFYAHITYRKIGDIDLVVKNNRQQQEFAELLEEIGFKKTGDKKASPEHTNFIYQDKNGIEVDLGVYMEGFDLGKKGLKHTRKELEGCKAYVMSRHFNRELKENLINGRAKENDSVDLEYLSGRAFVEDGFLVNSEKYSGLTSEEARKKMANWLQKNNLGEIKINYKLRDWLISRQRYWGAPIPIIYCHKCSANLKSQISNSKQIQNNNDRITIIDGIEYAVIPVPEENLPVKLPTDVDFKPTGESPLKLSKEFHDVKCPVCGEKAMRESDTMDTFVCSSWYFFRYSDPKNEKEFASKEQIKKWMPVDLYVGGAEHTVLHLLYSRFFSKVLHNLGYIDFDEPFTKLRHQGIIFGPDNQKMSKSKGNVINPDNEVKKWGADTLRLFEMFLGPLEDMKPWNTQGIVGIFRFLEKVWKLQFKTKNPEKNPSTQISNSQFLISNKIHKTIKKVGEDIENLRFNTAISAMMILVNELDKEKEILITDYKILLTLLSPFAPFLSEELWNKLGYEESIFREKWPQYDSKMIKDEEIYLVVQINGKVRDKIKVGADLSEDEAKKLALESEKVKNYLDGKEAKKIIFVKGRLVNIVL